MSSITLAGLGWQYPGNAPLFTDLTLTFGPVRTGLVGRNGTGKTTLLRLIAGELAPSSGRVACPGPVGFLRQNPEQDANATIADLFGARHQLARLARIERGQAGADDLDKADWTLEARLQATLTNLGLRQPPETPLSGLSGGQRTRANLAALMFAQPEVLLLDEPTNHLDRAGRRHVTEALRAWRGCVIVACHDRTLLEEMDAIVELTSLGARTYGGPYSAYRAAKDAELAAAGHELRRAERAAADARARARLAEDRKARTDRQGKRLRASGSQSKLLMDAAKERSEGSASSAARLRTRQAEAADTALQTARDAVEFLEPLRMDVPLSGLAPGRDVLQVDGLGFAYDTGAPVLHDLSFSLSGPERVAIEGANGAGKSTLLACIRGLREPRAGHLRLHVPAAFIDQDLHLLTPAETVADAFARLDPDATENRHRAMLARFLFRGEEANRRIGTLSGGQRMRAGLACALGHSHPPQLLLLDEPNNHLDIDAVETLEAALNAYDGALLVVSHDQAFLDRIGITRRVAL